MAPARRTWGVYWGVLDGLIRYIAQYSVRAAVDLDLRIEFIVGLLEQHPRLGRVSGDGKTREFHASATVKLLYQIRPKLNLIEIVRVLHTRRNHP